MLTIILAIMAVLSAAVIFVVITTSVRRRKKYKDLLSRVNDLDKKRLDIIVAKGATPAQVERYARRNCRSYRPEVKGK